MTIELLFPGLLLACWLLFGMFSMTANNHGRWVAFLVPLTPILFLAAWLLFALARVLIYPFFRLSGNSARYERALERIRHPYLWGFRDDADND